MPEQLSQDLPAVDTLDILGGDEEEETSNVDIIPEDIEEEVKDTTEEVIKDKETETESSDDLSLNSILGDNEEIKEEINTVASDAEEIKETIEEAKEAISNEDNNSAEKLIDDLYKQVIDYSTKIDTLATKNSILQGKLIELTNSNTDYELQIAQNVGKSNDPKMLILNRMYDGAVAGEEFAKNKVISALEDMYYTLTGESFEETRVDKISDSNAGNVILNELTMPEGEEEKKEDVNLNDISSIF